LPSAHKTQVKFRSHFSGGGGSASYGPGNTENITTLICEVLTAMINKIFGHDDGGGTFLETITLTYQHTCHHIPGDSITFIRMTSQIFTQKGKCGSWITPQSSHEVQLGLLLLIHCSMQCKSQSKSENKFSWWASTLDSCINGCTISSYVLFPYICIQWVAALSLHTCRFRSPYIC
jgi:hypothetical protein